MSNSFFRFKRFTIHQERCAMKVTTDACLFGAFVANDMQQNSSKGKLLDIGTGTSLLSLMIAQKNKDLNIDAIEIDSATASQAKENSSSSPWKELINIIHADARTFVPATKYDFIISNPPFYENELQSGKLQKNMAHHSSDLLLGDIFQLVKNNLTATGLFYLLLPYKRNKEIELLIRMNSLAVSEKLFVRQSVNHDFFRTIIKGSLRAIEEVNEKEISIKDDRQQYTKEFTELLKDYYLYL